MSMYDHAPPYNAPGDRRARYAQHRTEHVADPPNAIRAWPSSRPDDYAPLQTPARRSQLGQVGLVRAPEAPAEHRQVRRNSRSRLPGVVYAATGLGLCGEGSAMAAAPRYPAIGQLLWFAALIVPYIIWVTVLMVPQLGRLRIITIAILGVYPTVVYRISSPLVLAGFDEHLHEQMLLNLLRGSGLFAPNPELQTGPYYPGL